MEHIIFFSLSLMFSTLYSLFEIQIEGKNGWAANLPTWRFKPKFLSFIFKREITGFHLYGFLSVFILLHFIFVFLPWSLDIQLKIISFFLLSLTLEDFLWFVLNPSYGIKKFNDRSIEWHNQWFLGLPVDYWFLIPIGLTLYFLSL